MRVVYIVRCNDDSLYTGITNHLDQRIHNHNNEKTGAKYTKARRPVTLVWHKEVADRNEAASLEFHIKKMTKLQKQSLISGI